MGTVDPWDNAEARKFLRRVDKELVPMMSGSEVVVSLVPRGPSDIKYAVELGLSIMMDKPIIAVVIPGTKVPAKIVRVADLIVEADPSTEEGRRTLQETITRFMRECDD